MKFTLTTLFVALIYCTTFSQQFDIILRNGNIQTGDGSPAYKADIGIKGDEISEINRRIKGQADHEINASGLTIAPGFIDIHTHLEPLPIFPEAESHIRMGATTALGGPDGSSPLPLGKYLDSLETLGVGMNVAYLVGHNTVRSEVLGLENREPTVEELAQMNAIISKSMDAGAYGISTGLKYLPGTFAKYEEIVSLSKTAADKGGIYTSHLREEGLGLIEAVAEAISISKDAQIPVVLTHHKAIGKPMWGASKKTLAMVDEARADGLDIMVDQYPYTASHTWLGVLIPSWSMEGGKYKAFAKRCEDPILRDSIKQGILYNLLNDRGGGDLKRVQFSKFDWKPHLAGKTLYDWAIEEGMDPSPENGAELVIRAQLHRGANCIYHAINEEDVVRIMKHPMAMVGSDGRLNVFGKGHPHPRAYGTFPRVLGHYCRDKKVIPLSEAIRKMTFLPAQRMGLEDRGLIKKGYKADLTIFNASYIIDKATFESPHQYPVGIHYVLINGTIMLAHNEYIDVRAGHVLRGPAFKKK